MTDRWLLILAVMALFAGLGVMGFIYQQQTQPSQPMCTSAQAECSDRPYLGNP